MGLYKLEWKTSAERDIRKLAKPVIQRILEAVEALSNEPFPHGSRKLSGSEGSYRIRVGDYRVIYQFDAKRHAIIICHARHRKDVYR